MLGSHETDDPFCRDLCVRSDTVIVSVDYRHAPEARFPAAVDDALRRPAVDRRPHRGARWRARPAGRVPAGAPAATSPPSSASWPATPAGPAIAGQLLLTPVTDCDLTRGSYIENADGYVLTTPLMEWFWDHYADPADRTDPQASPLRAADLSDLPPALIVTGEFDPLRDEGNAYAEALAAAGSTRCATCRPAATPTRRSRWSTSCCRAPASRAEMADALRQFFGATVPA